MCHLHFVQPCDNLNFRRVVCSIAPRTPESQMLTAGTLDRKKNIGSNIEIGGAGEGGCN